MSKTLCLAVMLASLSSVGGALADTSKPLANQKAWDEAVERFSKDPDPKLAANRRLVMETERALAVALRYGDVESVAEKYFSPNYIQHDPNIPPGRDGLVRWFKSGAMQPQTKAGEKPNTTASVPAQVFAGGDTVTLIFDNVRDDPYNPPATYHYLQVAVFRIADGKLTEHWGGLPKGAPYCRLGMCDSKH